MCKEAKISSFDRGKDKYVAQTNRIEMKVKGIRKLKIILQWVNSESKIGKLCAKFRKNIISLGRVKNMGNHIFMEDRSLMVSQLYG